MAGLLHPPSPEPTQQVYGKDTLLRGTTTAPKPPAPDPPRPEGASGLIALCRECNPPQWVPARPGQRPGSVVRCCDRHGAKLVDPDGHDLAGAARPATVPQATDAPSRPSGRPLPSLAHGQVRAAEALGKHVECRCGVAGCNQIARVES